MNNYQGAIVDSEGFTYMNLSVKSHTHEQATDKFKLMAQSISAYTGKQYFYDIEPEY